MKRNPSSKRRRSSTKSALRLPDLEHAKAVVLNSLNSTDAKRGYCHAITHREASRNRSNFFWGTFRCKRPNATLAASSGFDQP
jgi:hypothetical protein